MHIFKGKKFHRENLKPLYFQEVFFGSQVAVSVQERRSGNDDNHLVFQFWYDKDGIWYPMDQPISSYWIAEVSDLMKRLTNWVLDNGISELNGYGWKKAK